MAEPYIKKNANDLIKALDWNNIQILGREELAERISGHTHAGGENGTPIATAGLADAAVSTAKLADGSVTSSKLADGSVTANKLAGGAVTGAMLANGAVTTDKLANGAVANAKLADGSVTAGKLAVNSVGTAAVLNDAITLDKIAPAVRNLLQQGGASGFIVVTPQAGWESVFNNIPAGADAHLHFPAGTYPVSQPIVVQGKRHIRITGSGPGSRILATNAESALVFRQNESVKVSDVYVETGGTSGANIAGALTFVQCREVSVRDAHVKCGADFMRKAACVSTRECQFVRVESCRLEVGHQQVGVQVINVNQSSETNIERNHLAVYQKPTRLALMTLLDDPRYRRSLVPLMAWQFPHLNDPTPPRNFDLVFNGIRVRFNTDPTLVQSWLQALTAQPPINIGVLEIRAHVHGRADAILAARGNIGAPSAFPAWLEETATHALPTMYQGIVVAGSMSGPVRIVDNAIHDALQGIHVGTRTSGTAVPPIQQAVITGNYVKVTIPSDSNRARHGIFLSGCDGAIIENNSMTAPRTHSRRAGKAEGLRLFGFYGRLVLIRQNHLRGFDTGIHLRPMAAASVRWLVENNVAEGATPFISPTAQPNVILSGNIT